MSSAKTAVSLQKSLLDEADALAQELDISRSRLFALAVGEFIQRHRNLELLEAIDNAYGDPPGTGERTLYEKMRAKHRRMVEGQW